MGGERLATEKRQSCYAMPESSLQYAVPSAKKEKAGGEGSGKRLWENRKWRKFFRQVSLKIDNLGAQQRLDPPLPTTVGFIAAVQARDERSCMAARDVLTGMASVAARRGHCSAASNRHSGMRTW